MPYKDPEKARESARESARRRRKADPEKFRKYDREYKRIRRKEDPEKARERNRRWAKANPEKVREKMRLWREANREKTRKQDRERRRKIRIEAIVAYGGECVCCGETEMAFLTFDHIDGDGDKARKRDKAAGSSLPQWLKNRNYPPGIQLLCANCHLAKTHNPGGCPHQEQQSLQWGKLKVVK